MMDAYLVGGGDVGPFISIIIPLYNKADSVLRTVSSAASQIDADFEIIVVNDGSTDGSAELVKIASVPRLRLIEQVNAGVSAARNHGIAAAEGKWIALLDADDLWSHDHLSGLLNAVESSDAIAAFSNVRLQSRAGEPLLDPNVPAQKVDDYFSFALSNGGYPISSSSIMALRDQLLAAGRFTEGISMGEDIDMWCRLACRGPFVYTARLSSTYNDARSSTRFAGGKVVFPLFAQRFPELISDGRLPTALVESGRRYVNFLMLEYARQLIDSGRHSEARTVLLNDCVPGYDVRRFLKRLARTSSLGRTLYRLLQERVSDT
jgi:glycosyltransferase involved in cell wall biosynthesis